MRDTLVEQRRDALLLSTDRARVDVDAVLVMLHASHWGGSVTRAILERAVENSITVGVYSGSTQLGFARVVTDLTTYAYLTDVIVSESARGQGIGSWMVEAIIAHPDLQGLRRIALLTRDAQALYARFGFTTEMPVSTYMELRRTGGRPAPSRS
jgi:ribosomal protein S18 acetylase RimI-like enzyme